MENIILLTFGLVALVTLGVAVSTMIRRSAAQREAGLDAAPRTPEDRERDRSTRLIWAVIVLIVIGGLLGAYWLMGATR